MDVFAETMLKEESASLIEYASKYQYAILDKEEEHIASTFTVYGDLADIPTTYLWNIKILPREKS